MNKIAHFKYGRFVFAFIVILLVFLSIVVSALISQHNTMKKEIHDDAQHELELIGTFTRDALLRMDYAAVEQFLNQWAEEHPEILEIKAVAPNSFVLTHYKSSSTSNSSISLKHHVSYEGRNLLFIDMTRDMSPIQAGMIKLILPLILGSVLLTVIIGFVLWYALKKLALIPLEKEIIMREQAEKKFRMILESAPDSMVFADKDGKILMVNSQTEVLFGYKREELEGKGIEILMPERFRERHRDVREQFILKPESRPMGLDIELYGLKRGGKEFPADISLSPVETEEGLFILSAIRDITERKLSEAKLKRSYNFQAAISSILSISLEPITLEEQLNNILDIILTIPELSLESMGCIYLVENGSRSMVMKAQRGLPEATKNECSTVPFTHCLCGKAASSRKIIFAECTDSSHEHHYGHDFPHGHYCVPIMSGDHTLGVINLVVKKGHIKSRDEEGLLTSVANTLAGIIEHSRTDVERQKLQTQLAQAEKLSALGRLTANVAHEIRNPLMLVGGFARRLNKSVSSGMKEKEYIEVITSEVVRLEKILRNVLAYSREPRLDLESHNINEIVDESLTKYGNMCKKHFIKLEKSYSDIPCLIIDKDQIIEVINNLLTNAIDSMPKGGTLNISTKKSSVSNKDYIILRVSDTGEGIPEDNLKVIFEPFYSTKLTGRGTGLGLSICKKIMEDHGGFIDVESSAGKGTIFSLFFPYKPEDTK